MMLALLKFEGSKLWYNKRNHFVLLAFLVCLLAMVLYLTIQDNNYWPQMEEQFMLERVQLEGEAEFVNYELEFATERLETDDSPEAQETVEMWSAYAEFLGTQRHYTIRQMYLAANYSPDRGQERLELWIARDQHLLNGLEAGLIDPNDFHFHAATPLEVRQRLDVNQVLLEEDIQPLNSPYEMTATNFLYQLSSFPWMLVVVIVLIMLSVGMFSSDAEAGAYKVLYSQPFRRHKIYATKYLLNLSAGIVLITLLIALFFGALTVIKELGDNQYPIFYMEDSYRSLTMDANADEMTLIPWSTYMLRVLPLYLGLCIFVIVLTGTVSLFMNSSANTLSIIISLLFLDYSFRILVPGDGTFYTIWPFTPLNLNGVLQGYYSSSALSYIILSIIITIILLLVGLLVLRKQDLKGGAA